MEQIAATTGTAPAVESSGPLDGVLDSNYLDDPGQSSDAGDSGEVVEESEQPEGEVEQEQSVAAPNTREARIQELAKKYGLNPNDPNQRKALEALAVTEKRMSDKDAHIEKLRKRSPVDEYLEEIQEKDTAPQPGQQEQPGQQKQQGQWQDPFPHWQGPPEYGRRMALTDFVQAISEGNEKGDFGKAATVFEEMFKREMAPYRNAIYGMIEEGLTSFEKEKLGDVLPTVRQTVAEREAQGARQFAEKRLRADPQFSADLDHLRKPLSDKVHVVEGEQGPEQYPDTLLNRIVMANPYIQHIKVEHRDPKQAKILTHMAQLDAIRNLMPSQQANPAQGKKLVQAGAEMVRRESNKERARQSMNSGSSSGGNRQTANTDYVSEISADRSNGLRLGDLFK